MNSKFLKPYRNEPALLVGISLLLVVSLLILNSIASYLFPLYFLYFILAIIAFFVFSHIDFDILLLFSRHLYVVSLILLVLPLLLSQTTRGVDRWVQIGGFTLQTTEIVRPFLILFFAGFFLEKKITFKRLILGAILALLPLVLILIQPSLGVTVLTATGILGVFLSIEYDKKKLIFGALTGLFAAPVFWGFLADYQKQRILGLLSPGGDPTGGGYNRIQSMIAVGSGKLWGRGLGEGVQTQLAFLPERHTDFIFASIAEEFGFLGTSIIILTVFFILYRLIVLIERSKSAEARAFVSGVFLSMLLQIFVHMGMNMGIMPITGVPLPLVSAGGSSLIATMITLGIVINTKKSQSMA